MGLFSFTTGDTGESIPVGGTGRSFSVFMVLPDDTIIEEPAYEGYGDFGGRDFFGVVAEFNSPEIAREYAAARKSAASFDRDEEMDEEDYEQAVYFAISSAVCQLDEKHREAGISIYYDTARKKLPRFARKPARWKDLKNPKDCPYQGFFFPPEA